jgi:hypothetical protein
MLDGRKTALVMSGAVGGEKPNRRAMVKSITFGGMEFFDVPAMFTMPKADGGITTGDTNRSLGNVGLPVISRFRVITDYSSDHLYLLPRPGAAKEAFRKDRSGMKLIFEGDHLRVTSVSPESLAATAGWKAGDKVKVTINGAAVEATVVSIDEKVLKATVKVQGETKERTVNLSDIVKQ